MRAFIVICCFLYATADNASEYCNGLLVDGVYYDKEVIKDNVMNAYQLIVDWKTNTLFFSYNNERDPYFISASIALDTNTFADIPGIRAGFATAVDQASGTVYVGGEYGIFTFDPLTKTAVLFRERGKYILDLFYKDKLYFVRLSNHKLYTFENDIPILVPVLKDFNVTSFAEAGNYQFFYDGDLYILEKTAGIENVKKYRKVGLYLRGITVNKEGKVYFSYENGLYTLDENRVLKKVATIENHYSVAFDNSNNMIYSAGTEIIKLTRSSKHCSAS